MYFRYGDRNEEVKLMQRALNEKMNLRLKADGSFGKLTEQALRDYQKLNGFLITGVYGQTEINALDSFISSKYIRDKNVELAAEQENLPVSIVKALREVEARADGFLYDGRVIILFERHKFYRNLIRSHGQVFADRAALSSPDICNPERGGYLGYEKEHDRLNRAIAISHENALKSASYGLFQILGSNHKEAGFINIFDFHSSQASSEHNQLKAFINFVKSNQSLINAIKQKNFVRIATLYNGKNQADNSYADKLKLAESRFIK